jgi:NADPH:quinone reductase-like Zn-dependent oxidoreductase
VRGAQIAELGSPPAPAEVAEPQPHSGDVVLRIEAVALNPLDLAVGGGRFYGGHPPLPYAPGCEAVGRSEDGGLVYLFGDGRGVAKPGFLAERVAVPADLPLSIPGGSDPVLAAAAGIAGIAGWVSVAWRAQPTPDDRVLVLGGTGTVGGLAAQAARLLGASRVVAVGSSDLHRIGEEFGDEGFTVCIDPVWGEPLASALPYAASHARIVHLGQSAAPEAPLRSADVRGKELTIMGHSNFAMTKQERDRAYLELLDHLVAGRIELELQTFPLEDVAAAWANQRGGKSVVLL